MPFKRGSHYRIQIRNLPGYGAFPETSTHVGSKALARQMEALIRRIAENGLVDPGWYDILDALRGGDRGKLGELTLPDLLRAHNDGSLDELRFRYRDPSLAAAIAEFKSTGVDYNTLNGLLIVEEMARRDFGEDCRLGVLRSGKSITKLCARAEREGGRSRSVKLRSNERKWDNRHSRAIPSSAVCATAFRDYARSISAPPNATASLPTSAIQQRMIRGKCSSMRGSWRIYCVPARRGSVRWF